MGLEVHHSDESVRRALDWRGERLSASLGADAAGSDRWHAVPESLRGVERVRHAVAGRSGPDEHARLTKKTKKESHSSKKHCPPPSSEVAVVVEFTRAK